MLQERYQELLEEYIKAPNKTYFRKYKCRRDQFCGRFCEAMWLMMQHNKREDWVVANGKSISVKEFLKKSFEYVNLDAEEYLPISDKYFRPNEVNFLQGDRKIKKSLIGNLR